MPLPAPSFTRTKWLGFFAELTAKLTHHNVLVVIEGCEMLKRLLTTRISIAAVLQEGDLLAHFTNALAGGLQGDRQHARAGSATVLELNEELMYTQLETLSFCVDLMASLYADGDAYDKLLVLARAGPMVEVLLEALQSRPDAFFGLIARVLHALLRLPLGRRTPPELSEAALAEGPYTVAIQKHLDELRQLALHHGPLLQDAVDALTVLVATTEGPRRFCVMELLNLAKKRLRKFLLRRATEGSSPSSSTVGRAATKATTAADPNTATTTTTTALDGANDGASQFTRDADFEVELDDHIAEVNLSVSCAGPETSPRGDDEEEGVSERRTPRTGYSGSRGAGVGPRTDDDVSKLVDAEPSEVPFELPAYLVDEVLVSIAASRSHAQFFTQLDLLWCLATADVAVVSAQLTGDALSAVERFLTVAPNTRQDRLVFVSLLQWTCHVLSGVPLKNTGAREVLLKTVCTALWRILAADLREREEKDARQRNERTTQQNLFMPHRRQAVSAQQQQRGATSCAATNPITPTDDEDPADRNDDMDLAEPTTTVAAAMTALEGDAVPADLLPYSMARRTADELRLQSPSVAAVILSYFLSVEHGCHLMEIERWLSASADGGDAWRVVAHYLQRVQGARSVLLDAPTTVDGALSEELYLSWSLKGALTDDLTVATLSSKLVTTLASRHDLRQSTCAPVRARDASNRHVSQNKACATGTLSAESVLSAMATLAPLLMRLAVQNPTLTCAGAGGASSPLYYCPANPHATRYSSLGECALLALEACGTLAATLTDTSRPDGVLSLQNFLLPHLPALFHITRDCLHAGVRAVPFRLLRAFCKTEADVDVSVATLPSIWRTTAASVLRCGGAGSQWETAAAAEWLTALLGAHGERLARAHDAAALAGPREVVLPTSGLRVVRAREDADSAWASLSDVLVESVCPHLLDAATSSPLCYGAAALLQLAVALHKWQSRCRSQSPRVSSLSVLLPRGAHSMDGWGMLALKATHTNSRLVRLASLLITATQEAAHNGAARSSHSTKAAPLRAVYALESLTTQYYYTASLCDALSALLEYLVSARQTHLPSCSPPLSPSSASASASAETAKACLSAFQSSRWTGELLASLFASPEPNVIHCLVAHRVGLTTPLSRHDLDDLHRAYGQMISAGCVYATCWITHIVVPAVHRESERGEAVHNGVGSWRGVSSKQTFTAALLPGTLLESVSALWGRLAQTDDDASEGAVEPPLSTPHDTISQTEDEANLVIVVAMVLASLLEACAASVKGTLLLAPLEPRAAAMLRATWTVSRRCNHGHRGEGAAGGVAGQSRTSEGVLKALQCLLVQCFSGANEAARASHLLATEAAQLEKDMASIQDVAQRGARSLTRQGHHAMQTRLEDDALPPFLQRLSLLTSVFSYAQPAVGGDAGDKNNDDVPRAVRQSFCAALCEALFTHATQVAALEAVRCLTTSEVGRRCLVHEVTASGEPIARTVFGRVLVLTFELPTVWSAGRDGRTAAPAAASRRTPRGRSRSAQGGRASSFHGVARAPVSPVPLTARDANAHAPAASGKSKRANPVEEGTEAAAEQTGELVSAANAAAGVAASDATNEDVVWLCYDVCTLACRADTTLFVPWLLKCHVIERVSDLFVLHDLKWRKRANASAAAQVRAHYFFDMPHWQRTSQAVPREARPAAATAAGAATERRVSSERFRRLLRFLATISLDAEAQRWIFRQAALLTILLELAGEGRRGDDEAESVMALLVLRNLCFHPSLKTVLCQDMRLLLTLKAVAMGLTSVRPLLLAPAEEQTTVATLAATAATATSRKAKAANSQRGRGGDHEVGKEKKPPVAGALTPELRGFLTTSDRTNTSMISSALTDWATTLVSQNHLREVISPAPSGTPEAASVAKEPRSSHLQRQSLAVSALWSLLFDHQRGKMYVRRVLTQEPVLHVDTVCDELPKEGSADGSSVDLAATIAYGLQQIQELCGGAL